MQPSPPFVLLWFYLIFEWIIFSSLSFSQSFLPCFVSCLVPSNLIHLSCVVPCMILQDHPHDHLLPFMLAHAHVDYTHLPISLLFPHQNPKPPSLPLSSSKGPPPPLSTPYTSPNLPQAEALPLTKNPNPSLLHSTLALSLALILSLGLSLLSTFLAPPGHPGHTPATYPSPTLVPNPNRGSPT